jgi:hypothetical protein
VCPADAADDADGDGLCADADICPEIPNPRQEPFVFPEPIRFLDQFTIVWDTPAAVDYVWGYLSQVADYGELATWTHDAVTSVPAGTFFPIPEQGDTYHLIKPAGRCGSWQTAPGAEPERDAVLP